LKTIAHYRGFTILEVLISFALFLLTLTIVYNFLLFSYDCWKFGESRMDASMKSLIPMEKIRREIQGSLYQSITNNTSSTPKALSFASARNDEGKICTSDAGELLIQKAVIYYMPDGAKTLRRIEFASASSTPLTVKELKQYCDGGGRVISRKMKNFIVVTDDVKKSISIKVESEVLFNGRKNSLPMMSVVNFVGE